MNILSIIIATFNEEIALPKLLDSLLFQIDTDITSIPIIIADNDSTDNTLKIIETYKKKELDIKLVKGGHCAEAKNNGAQVADSEYILLLDADVTFPPHFISTLINYINNFPSPLYTFNFKCENGQILTSLMWKTLNFLNMIKIFGNIGVGSAMLTSKKAFEEKGSLREDIVLFDDVTYYRKFKKSELKRIPVNIYIDPRRFNKKGFFNLLFNNTSRFIYTLFTKDYEKHDIKDYYN
jgi:glycosyltransferase involved in cell wall biosynthesis